jgi:two-component system OmpR family response regulator
LAFQYNGRVLLVDDNDHVRHMLSLALEYVGFDVLTAGTHQQARDRLARTQPDALVLNLQRSEADGLDLLRHVRARHDLCAVPIVFLAGCDTGDFRWRTIRAGADWFGLRPLGMLELQKRIGKLIRLGRPRLKLIAACKCPLPSRRLEPTG